MREIWVIVTKEIIDNLRDKRSLFFSLLYGPIFLPLIVIGPIIAGVKKHAINFETPKVIYAVGADTAPNLVAFLRTQNLDVESAPDDFQARIKDESLTVVMELADDYEASLREGNPAKITIYFSEENSESSKLERQLSNALKVYDRTLRESRIAIRGMDKRFLDPFDVQSENLAEEKNKSHLISRTYMFVLIMSMMLGGFYLAVDTGAGERERNSLEPLLSLPLTRLQIVLGKLGALFAFVLLAGVLPIVVCCVAFQFFPDDVLSSLMDASFMMFIKSVLVILPLAIVVPSFLLLIGSYARNTKEAQTHLGFAMLVPMLPLFALQFFTVKTALWSLTLPVMSQFKLMESVFAGESLTLAHYGLSVLGTVLMASLFMILTIGLYKRDKLLT